MSHIYIWSVSEGHPDKLCDRVSIPSSLALGMSLKHVGSETLATTNRVILAGEVVQMGC